MQEEATQYVVKCSRCLRRNSTPQVALGTVLYQRQDDTLRVIAYASRSVSKTESNYPAHKLEFLALKWAVYEKFHEYLYGSKPFEIYTDNNPLTYVLTSAKLDACDQRWVAKLANYNFTIRYRCGQSNVEADALSRISWPKILSNHGDVVFCFKRTKLGIKFEEHFIKTLNIMK